MTRVVVAPDSFKGSMAAADVAHHLALGLRSARPDAVVDEVPLADGGEGTVDAAVASGLRRTTVRVAGPTGEPVDADLALGDDLAVVELASASGLARLPGARPDPLRASTCGTGELVLAALGAGARRLVLALGGSATTDGGAGLLQALGARLLGADGRPLAPGGATLVDLEHVDLTRLDPRLAGVDVELASDVDSPLLGPHGAAAVFAPQKGATPDDVRRLERGLARWADVLARSLPAAADAVTAAGAGAAGGAGFAALAVLGARRRPGVEVVAELVRLPERVAGADLVVTGEGSLDAQSLRGKAPVGVARVAAAHGVPVVAVCGRLSLGPDDVARAGFAAAHPLTDLEPDEAVSRARPGPLLERTGHLVALRHLDVRPGG
ncbi:glycerate kinase [Angustibacter peucedani]